MFYTLWFCIARYATHGANGWTSDGCTDDASEADGSCTTSSNAVKIISLLSLDKLFHLSLTAVHFVQWIRDICTLVLMPSKCRPHEGLYLST